MHSREKEISPYYSISLSPPPPFAEVQDKNAAYSRIRALLDRLPTHNRATLEVLMQHLCCVTEHQAQNKMSVQNLSLIFGTSVIRPRPENIE